MSHYIFKGRLCGLICPECPEPLSNLKVRLYRLRGEQNAVVLAVANPKDTLAVLSDEQVQAKAKTLLAEVETDALGSFTFELGEKQGYKGEAFEVDVYCGTVPRRKPGRAPPKPRQFSVTTIQPLWRQREDIALAVWDYCIPNRFWCHFRSLFGAWTICGRLRTCVSPQTPIAGATVKAFDADWLQDDPLGSAVTDATGRFRLDYLADDFKKDVLGLNIELLAAPISISPPSSAASISLMKRRPMVAVQDEKMFRPAFVLNSVLTKCSRRTWNIFHTGNRWKFSTFIRFRPAQPSVSLRKVMRAGRPILTSSAVASH